uniref:sugar phosphate nucleotidyltransferase n=2 Tax=Polynucleobacter sp. TaxID=2029855 RepID=UPI00404899AF
MHIIIPMSGFGERFRKAGYQIPKPLISIDGKPIIGHVIDMFPNEKKITFICNSEHLESDAYDMRAIILNHCPTANILSITPHKLGPIHAVLQASNFIDDSEEVVVNYCDFSCYWDWQNFKEFVSTSDSAGCIPAYKGFHPHSLGSTNYAYLKECAGWISDIQEKQPFTSNRMEEFASSGTYYFKNGQLLKDAFNYVINEDLSLNGEFYVSLAYKYLFKERLPVSVYPLQHFMQWGTPEDVHEYLQWSSIFRSFMQPKKALNQPTSGATIIPMAGLGKRFSDEGYQVTKPLIPVSGKPMVIRATEDLPQTNLYSFVLRSDMKGYQEISRTIQENFSNSVITSLDEITNGQATSALIGIDAIKDNIGMESPITIGACDNGAIFSIDDFQNIVNEIKPDVLVWGTTGHVNAIRKPEMFGWIEASPSGKITQVSVKKPLKNPSQDPIVIGTFTFKNIAIYKKCYEKLVADSIMVNGEFYIDSMVNVAIELGLKCQLFTVEHFISWGTPNDLRTYEYWQSCFHKWSGHPYSIQKDLRIPTKSISDLLNNYKECIIHTPTQC